MFKYLDNMDCLALLSSILLAVFMLLLHYYKAAKYVRNVLVSQYVILGICSILFLLCDDAVDFKLISLCEKGDLVVTQDYGVAAMALSKGAYAIHQSGKWYTNENIDLMLMERHISKKARLASTRSKVSVPVSFLRR